MSFPTTLSNLKIYIDSKENSAWTTRVDGPDEFIVSIPPISPATLSLTAVTSYQTNTINEPTLVNNEIVFQDETDINPGDGPHFNIGTWDGGVSTELSLGESTSTPDFVISCKFKIAVGETDNNGCVISNDAAHRNFGIELNNELFDIRVKGKKITLSDGVTEMAEPPIEGWNYITLRANLANQTGDIIVNGNEYNDLTLDGTNENGTGLVLGSRKNGSTPIANGAVEYLIGAQTYPTLQEFRDLDLFINGEAVGNASGVITYEGSPVEGATVDLMTADQIGTEDASPAEEDLTTNASGVVTATVVRNTAKDTYFRVHPYNRVIDGLTGTLTATDATNLDLGIDLSALDTSGNKAYTIRATGGTGNGEVVLITGYTDKTNGLVQVLYHPFGNDTTFEVCRLLSGGEVSVLPRTE